MEEKIRSLKNGSTENFKEIYDAYYKKVFILCLKVLNNNEDALDATQETFIEVFKSINTLNDVSRFNVWLNKIAISKCSYIIRKSKDSLLSDNDDFNSLQDKEKYTPEAVVCEDEKRRIVLEAIDKLSIKKKEVILLYYYSELSIDEISEVLEIPSGTVKSRMNSAKKDLEKYIYGEDKKAVAYNMALPALLLLLNDDSKIAISSALKVEYDKIKSKFTSKSSLAKGKSMSKVLSKSFVSKVVIGVGVTLTLSPQIKNVVNNMSNESAMHSNSQNDLKENGQEDLINNKIDDDKHNTKNKPQIVGANDITIKVGTEFDLGKGVYVKDDSTGNIQAKAEGIFDVNKPGTYEVKYTAIDNDGNKNEVIRKINVIE